MTEDTERQAAQKTWKFAVTTRQGIYNGEITGVQEPGETDEEAIQSAAAIARDYIQGYRPGVTILACFVSDSALLIDAPGATLIDINIETDIRVPEKPGAAKPNNMFFIDGEPFTEEI